MEKGTSVSSSSESNNNQKRNSTARVYALQHEDAPIVDTLAGNVLVSTSDAYALVDTDATHTCISEEFATNCGLPFDVISDAVMSVSTPLGDGSVVTRICKSVDVTISDTHMPVDMLVLPIADFDVVLGMNWLSKYQIIIDCSKLELKFECGGKWCSSVLLRQRPMSMLTIELWEKPLLAAVTVEVLIVDMVPIVREFPDVFLDDLLGLPPD